MENLEDLKEELKYLNEVNDTQFDVIGNLYGTMIAAVLNNEISAMQFNTICKAYEILGGDTWHPETILHKGISISDPGNISSEYFKYLINKQVGKTVKERIENLLKDFFLVSQPFQQYVESVNVYIDNFDDNIIRISINSKFQNKHSRENFVLEYNLCEQHCYLIYVDEYYHSEIVECGRKCAAKLENYLNKKE